RRREGGADGDEIARAVDEAVALPRRIAIDQRGVWLDVVDDRKGDLGEAAAFENLDEARLDAPPPRGLLDQQRTDAGGIGQFGSHQQKTPSPHRRRGRWLSGCVSLSAPFPI